MYAYVELSNIAHTDSRIQSLSWMNYISTSIDDNDSTNRSSLSLNYQEGWLATGNTNHIVSVTYTSIKSDENLIIPDRTNFNLRAHRTEVRLVSWNVPYQKLATVDEKGVIFVWVKHDNRWSLELINDRNHPVIDMSWSHDGRMTVICYEDGFILAGSVTGQRYWSTVLNIAQAKISAVTWMPDVSHVILGTTGGQLFVMDHHGNTTEAYSVTTHTIRQLMYSCDKFYPDALDNNATKFLNDDYILACSLENGQILLLNNCQDQSPIIVDTNLENIKIDWSSPDQILVVGGHKYLNKVDYINQIIFYTRRGEILQCIHIPQTSEPLSALCWAHGNDIVFVACGSSVYTIWITHKPLPSMLTLCQMKIKNSLLKNSLENFDKLDLPNNLKSNILNHYRIVIKGFLPDPKHLRSFVCNPLKSHLRLQCTMKRIDNDRDNLSTKGPTHNLSRAVYVLYLEYLGGLVPILTAKRISKLCPDFIIFDPQLKTNEVSVKQISKINSPTQSIKSNVESARSRSNTFHNVSNIQQAKSLIANRSSLIMNRKSIYIAETNLNNENNPIFLKKTNSDSSSDNESDNELFTDSYDKRTRKCSTASKMNKLCTIAANIWGTRFKFYGHSNHLPNILGCVTYKTSFLHFQPRQMTVTITSNSLVRKQRQLTKSKRKNSRYIDNIKSFKRSTEPILSQLATVHSNSISQNPMNMKSRIAQSQARLQRTSVPTTNSHLHQRSHIDSSRANSSSASPINLSRSTSPAASVVNFIRPISPPFIQVKEPLSPKFSRASSTTITNHVETTIINSPTTAAMASSAFIDDSSNQKHLDVIANIPESCFEPETYRNLYPLNSSQQKKLSLSDPTLNQTTKVSRCSHQLIESKLTTADEYFSSASLHHQRQISTDDDNELENFRSSNDKLKQKISTTLNDSRKKYSSPRHRMMTCTKGVTDSLTTLVSSSDRHELENFNETSVHIMQNRPPLWNEQSQVYQLDFGGRVTLESAKNFQIEYKGKQVIQFGRIENNCYTLDFEWPFSPLQAFAVALANITQRLK